MPEVSNTVYCLDEAWRNREDAPLDRGCPSRNNQESNNDSSDSSDSIHSEGNSGRTGSLSGICITQPSSYRLSSSRASTRALEWDSRSPLLLLELLLRMTLSLLAVHEVKATSLGLAVDEGASKAGEDLVTRGVVGRLAVGGDVLLVAGSQWEGRVVGGWWLDSQTRSLERRRTGKELVRELGAVLVASLLLVGANCWSSR